MSCFSRGCFLRHQWLVRHLQPLQSFPKTNHPRGFSASILRAAKPARKSTAIKPSTPATKSSYAPLKSSPDRPYVHQTFATTLAQKSHPTSIYEAPSHTLFMVTSYSGAVFFLIYGGYACFNYFSAPPGIPVYVPYAFGVAGFFMAAFAGWLILGPAKLIRSITAIPTNLTAAAKNFKKASLATAQGSVPEVQLEIELRKMLPIPFFPARKLYCKPRELILPEALAPPAPAPLSSAELLIKKRAQNEENRKLVEYERGHIMSAPFRHGKREFSGLFGSIRRSWTREGFSSVEIDGRFYKLDTIGGWALDKGRALDRLATVKRTL